MYRKWIPHPSFIDRYGFALRVVITFFANIANFTIPLFHYRKHLLPAQMLIPSWVCSTKNGRVRHPFKHLWMFQHWPNKFKIWQNSWNLLNRICENTKMSCNHSVSRRITIDLLISDCFYLCLNSVSAKDWYELGMTDMRAVWLKKTLKVLIKSLFIFLC